MTMTRVLIEHTEDAQTRLHQVVSADDDDAFDHACTIGECVERALPRPLEVAAHLAVYLHDIDGGKDGGKPVNEEEGRLGDALAQAAEAYAAWWRAFDISRDQQGVLRR